MKLFKLTHTFKSDWSVIKKKNIYFSDLQPNKMFLMAFPKDDPRRVLFFPQGRWNINSVEVDSCDVVRSFNAVHIQLFLYKDEKYTEKLPLWVCDLQQDFNKNLRPKENPVFILCCCGLCWGNRQSRKWCFKYSEKYSFFCVLLSATHVVKCLVLCLRW